MIGSVHMQNDTVSDEHITQEEHGEDVPMSDSNATSIVVVSKCPSPVSNSVPDGGSVSKKYRSKRRSFTVLKENFSRNSLQRQVK